LLEVLVSILVFSFGLVGMLGVSVTTFENNKIAQIRMIGIGLANDYAERARMNIRGYDSSGYSVGQSDGPATTAVATPSATETNGASAATSMAAKDKDDFLREVARRLPGGDAVVKTQAAGFSRNLHVWLLWKEPGAQEDDSVAKALFTAAEKNCPSDLSADDKKLYSCMYFLVPL
jgi:type IV pilus assembly protein PilV